MDFITISLPKQESTPRRWLSRTRAAAYLGISVYRLKQLVANEAIKPMVLIQGKAKMFSVTALDKFLARHAPADTSNAA